MSEEEIVATEESEVETPKKKKKEKSKTQKIIEWILFGIFVVLFGFVAAGVVDGYVHKKENNNMELRFGYGSFIVLTNSMEPKYKVNTALITYKEDLGKVTSELKSISGATIARDDDEQFVIAFTKEKSLDMTFFNKRTTVDEEHFDFVYKDLYDRNYNPDAKCIVKDYVMTHRIMELHIFKNVKYGNGRYVFVTSGINNETGVDSLKGQYQFVTEKEYLGIVKLNSDFLGQVFKFITSIWGLLILLLLPAFYLIITSGIDIFKVLKETDEPSVTNGEMNNAPSSLDNLSKEDRERLKREMLDEMIAKKGKKKDDEQE